MRACLLLHETNTDRALAHNSHTDTLACDVHTGIKTAVYLSQPRVLPFSPCPCDRKHILTHTHTPRDRERDSSRRPVSPPVITSTRAPIHLTSLDTKKPSPPQRQDGASMRHRLDADRRDSNRGRAQVDADRRRNADREKREGSRDRAARQQLDADATQQQRHKRRRSISPPRHSNPVIPAIPRTRSPSSPAHHHSNNNDPHPRKRSLTPPSHRHINNDASHRASHENTRQPHRAASHVDNNNNTQRHRDTTQQHHRRRSVSRGRDTTDPHHPNRATYVRTRVPRKPVSSAADPHSNRAYALDALAARHGKRVFERSSRGPVSSAEPHADRRDSGGREYAEPHADQHSSRVLHGSVRELPVPLYDSRDRSPPRGRSPMRCVCVNWV